MLERQRRIGEIVEHAFERIVEQRQPVLHARIAAARAHRFVQQIVWGGCTEFRHIAGAEAADGFGDELEFRHRHQIEPAQLRFAALRLRIETADGLQRVAEEIEAHRHVHAGRIEIEDAAAHRIVARLAHGRGAGEAVELQPRHDARHANDIAGRDRQRVRRHELARRHALQRGVHCGEQQRRLVAPFHTRQSRQRGHALRHHGRIGRHPVVGQTIPGREFHGENVWPEERQRARQRRHALAVAADHRERNRRRIAARPDAPAISLAVICRDGQRMAALSRALAFFGPDILTMEFPAWDCLPYDRVSPNASVVAQRMTALSRLARVKGRDKPSLLLTTVNAALQRVPAREFVATHALSVAPGNVIGMASIMAWLELNGFTRASTVREPGDYAVRGGILDLYPPGMDMPVRFDFFGDALETIRSFDAQTQRSETQLRGLDLVPVAEFQLVTETIRRFRTGYVAEFGAASPDDLLYEAVSAGRRYPGMEHWLPLFHNTLESVFDYLPDTPLALEHLAEDAAHERLTQIADYYDARHEALKDGVTPPYKPLPPARLYLAETEWKERLGASALAKLTPFAVPEARDVLDVGALGREI